MTDLRRRKTDAPACAGWYYARFKGTPVDQFPIQPTEVGPAPWDGASLGVWDEHADKLWPLDAFEWFGQVQSVEEEEI